jgi:hypothetical protein
MKQDNPQLREHILSENGEIKHTKDMFYLECIRNNTLLFGTRDHSHEKRHGWRRRQEINLQLGQFILKRHGKECQEVRERSLRGLVYGKGTD